MPSLVGSEMCIRDSCLSVLSVCLSCLSVCLSVCGVVLCNIRVLYWLRELHKADFHQFGIYGSGRVCANAWDVFRRTPSRGGRGCRAAVDFVVDFGCGGISSFSSICFLRTHMACCEYEAGLPHLPLY